MTVQCTACTPISVASDWKVHRRKLKWMLSASWGFERGHLGQHWDFFHADQREWWAFHWLRV